MCALCWMMDEDLTFVCGFLSLVGNLLEFLFFLSRVRGGDLLLSSCQLTLSQSLSRELLLLLFLTS